MWWWIKPLFKTGLICALIDVIIFAVLHNVKNNILVYIAFVLILPLGMSVCASIVWLLIEVFKEIWCPYL